MDIQINMNLTEKSDGTCEYHAQYIDDNVQYIKDNVQYIEDKDQKNAKYTVYITLDGNFFHGDTGGVTEAVVYYEPDDCHIEIGIDEIKILYDEIFPGLDRILPHMDKNSPHMDRISRCPYGIKFCKKFVLLGIENIEKELLRRVKKWVTQKKKNVHL